MSENPSNSEVKKSQFKYNRLTLNALPEILGRYKVSNRVGVAIATATLQDVCLVTKGNMIRTKALEPEKENTQK